MASIGLSRSDVSESSSESGHEGQEWEDLEPDQEESEFISLFDEEKFGSINAMLEYAKDKYHFDFAAVQGRFALDFYGMIKLVNYIRSETKNGNLEPNVSSIDKFSDDRYLKPVLENDAVLFSLGDLNIRELDNPQTAEHATSQGDATQGDDAQEDTTTLKKRIKQLEDELSTVSLHFNNYRNAVLRTLGGPLSEEDLATDVNGMPNDRDKAKRPLTNTANGEKPNADAELNSNEKTKDSTTESKEKSKDDDYFNAYSYNDIHETMLKDTVRTDAYRDFVYDNKHLFQDKVVLDVGCGTGILSMFCARAGANQVIAVDNSNIIGKARAIIEENCLESAITCVKGKIEDITLPVDKVDVIISEWMGYGLLYEAMLKSVIWARDRYLKPGGLMVPSHTVLRIAPITDPDFIVENIHFWDDVYGFNMTPMRENIYDDVLIRELEATTSAGDSFPFLVLDLLSTKAEDLTFSRGFSVALSHDIENLDGFALWFDVFFLMPGAALAEDARGETFRKDAGKGCAFTTGPHGRETHWKCAVLLIDQSKHRTVALGRGTKISGSISYAERGSNKRGLDVEVTWVVEGANRYGQQMWVLQ